MSKVRWGVLSTANIGRLAYVRAALSGRADAIAQARVLRGLRRASEQGAPVEFEPVR
jgi:hypothetical protein